MKEEFESKCQNSGEIDRRCLLFTIKQMWFGIKWDKCVYIGKFRYRIIVPINCIVTIKELGYKKHRKYKFKTKSKETEIVERNKEQVSRSV